MSKYGWFCECGQSFIGKYSESVRLQNLHYTSCPMHLQSEKTPKLLDYDLFAAAIGCLIYNETVEDITSKSGEEIEKGYGRWTIFAKREIIPLIGNILRRYEDKNIKALFEELKKHTKSGDIISYKDILTLEKEYVATDK